MEPHQLDPELPDRLVGACPTCKTWALRRRAILARSLMAQVIELAAGMA